MPQMIHAKACAILPIVVGLLRPLSLIRSTMTSGSKRSNAWRPLVVIDKEIEMGKKLKALAGNLTENQLALTVKDSAQQIWLAGLGAFAKAQQEGGKVFDALVKEGESIQARTRQATDEKVAAVAGKAAIAWDRLELVFENRVARALSSLGVPSKKDIDQLAKRVAELTAVVDGLTQAKPAAKSAVNKPAVKAAPKPAVKAVVKPKAAAASAKVPKRSVKATS